MIVTSTSPGIAVATIKAIISLNIRAVAAQRCMLSGARRVHPVIVGWSTPNRPLIPSPSNDDPAAAWPRATPGRNWVVLDVAVRHRMVVRTESLRIPNWHDTGSTSPRSGGEVALIWDTISHYSPVLIAPLAIDFIAPAHPEKKRCAMYSSPTI